MLVSAFAWQLVQVNPVCASWLNFEWGSQRIVMFAGATAARIPVEFEARTLAIALESLPATEGFVGLHRAMLVSGNFCCVI